MKLIFEFEKETKRTYRYNEVNTSYVGALYVSKLGIDKLGGSNKDKLVVDIQLKGDN